MIASAMQSSRMVGNRQWHPVHPSLGVYPTLDGPMKFVDPCTASLHTDVLANLTRPPSSLPIAYNQGVRTFAKAAAKAPAAAAKRPALPCNLHGVYGTYVLYQRVWDPASESSRWGYFRKRRPWRGTWGRCL